jgi:hypothetical protein
MSLVLLLILFVLVLMGSVPAQAALAPPLPTLTVDRASGVAASTTFDHSSSALTESRYVRLEAALTTPAPAGITLSLQSRTLAASDTAVLDVRDAADVRPSGVYALTLTVQANTSTPVGSYNLVVAVKTIDKRSTASVTGITPSSREYDGTNTASYSGSLSLSGVAAGDTVSLDNPALALDGKNAGRRDLVVTGSLTGSDAFKYLFDPVVVDGSGAQLATAITPKAVNIVGVTATKSYDGTNLSSPSQFSGGTVMGAITGEVLDVDLSQAAGSYASKDAHADLPLTGVTGIGLTPGLATLASNYRLVAQPVVLGSITERTLTVTDITATKVYDGTTDSAPSQFSGGTISGAAIGEMLALDFSAASGSYATPDVHASRDMTGLTGITLVATPPALASNYRLAGQPSVSGSITARLVTVTGITATKPYDGTASSAPSQFSGGTIFGALAGETLSLDLSAASATYSSSNVHTRRNMMDVADIGLIATPPALASNYRFAYEPVVTGTVIARSITITGITATKPYDGTASSTPSQFSGGTIVGAVAGETLTVRLRTASATYATRDVHTSRAMTGLSGIMLAATPPAFVFNYRLASQPVVLGSVTPRTLTATDIMATKVYDGTTASTPSQFSGGVLSGVVAGETLYLDFAATSPSYATSDVHQDLPMTGTSGLRLVATPPALASNYRLAGQPAVVGTITARAVSIQGVTASSKTYDGNAEASMVLSLVTLQGVIPGDSVALDSSQASASFDTKDVGDDKTVSFTGFSLSGSSAKNYSLLAQPAATTANITPADITISDITATKVYDGTTASTPSEFSGGTISGAVAGETLTLDISAASGSYASKDVQASAPMGQVTGISIEVTPPALVSNYRFATQFSVAGTILPRALSFTGTLGVPAKVYDGTTTAPAVSDIALTNPTSFSGLVGQEGFTLSIAGITALDPYPSPDGGNYALGYTGSAGLVAPTGGALQSNYQLSTPPVYGAITQPIRLTITTTANNQILYLNKYFANAYSVDWGDNSPKIDKPAGTTSHIYAQTGSYVVTLAPYQYSEYAQWTFSSTNTVALVPQAGNLSTITLTTLPAMHYFMADATSAPAYFFATFNYYGALTSLPAGSFDISSITTAPVRFFYQFNRYGSLTSLPAGSFNTSAITAVGSEFFAHFNPFGSLTSLPDGSFNTSSVVTAGDRFFDSFNYLGKLTTLPASFVWPKLSSPVGSYNFWYSFNSTTVLHEPTTAQSIINTCPTPAFKTYCFSVNQPGYPSLPSNWRG